MNIPQVLILMPSPANCPRELEGRLERDSASRPWSVGSKESGGFGCWGWAVSKRPEEAVGILEQPI